MFTLTNSLRTPYHVVKTSPGFYCKNICEKKTNKHHEFVKQLLKSRTQAEKVEEAEEILNKVYWELGINNLSEQQPLEVQDIRKKVFQLITCYDISKEQLLDLEYISTFLFLTPTIKKAMKIKFTYFRAEQKFKEATQKADIALTALRRQEEFKVRDLYVHLKNGSPSE